jgi:hypothetical protein
MERYPNFLKAILKEHMERRSWNSEKFSPVFFILPFDVIP